MTKSSNSTKKEKPLYSDLERIIRSYRRKVKNLRLEAAEAKLKVAELENIIIDMKK